MSLGLKRLFIAKLKVICGWVVALSEEDKGLISAMCAETGIRTGMFLKEKETWDGWHPGNFWAMDCEQQKDQSILFQP